MICFPLRPKTRYRWLARVHLLKLDMLLKETK